MFKSLLVANRGEIACRVIRACKELGITPYTVYSDIDANSPHVALVGPSNAFHIGGNPAQQSYLKADRIVQVARENGIEAIPPRLRIPIRKRRLRPPLRRSQHHIRRTNPRSHPPDGR